VDRILARLERRFGKLAVEHLTWIIVGGMALVFAVSYVRPDFVSLLTLDLSRVARGQVWRLFTYIFIPRDMELVWVFFALYWLWIMGSSLEAEWGAFKFNVYYLVGMLGTTIAAAIAGGAIGGFYLNLSITFAFATVFPDYQLYLFFIIPIRMKWVGLIAAAYFVRDFIVLESWTIRAALVAAVLNYFVFFTGHLIGLARGRAVMARQSVRRESFRPPSTASGSEQPMGQRVCALCGAREADGADIRVCSCEKCGGPRTLCLEHARSH
jgi:hypothetical protein